MKSYSIIIFCILLSTTFLSCSQKEKTCTQESCLVSSIKECKITTYTDHKGTIKVVGWNGDNCMLAWRQTDGIMDCNLFKDDLPKISDLNTVYSLAKNCRGNLTEKLGIPFRT